MQFLPSYPFAALQQYLTEQVLEPMLLATSFWIECRSEVR